MGSGVAQQGEPLFLVTANTRDAHQHAHETRQAGDGKLLDANRHFRIGLVGVELEYLLAIITRGQTLPRRACEAVVN